jgi:hypothetical protein
VTVILPEAELDRAGAVPDWGRPGGFAPDQAGRGWTQTPTGAEITAGVLAVGRRIRERAREAAAADQGSAGGCAHGGATTAYRPSRRLGEYVIARDQTCRYPFCGQPAWRGDLDHTHPWGKGGRTCRCNLGALCRRHHRLKQLPGWQLAQPQPGAFRWATPAGLLYEVRPDPQAA